MESTEFVIDVELKKYNPEKMRQSFA